MLFSQRLNVFQDGKMNSIFKLKFEFDLAYEIRDT